MSNYEQPKPTLHKEFFVNQRVRYTYGDIGVTGTGTIIGIASMHVIFVYIVLLDEPIDSEIVKGWRGLAIPGTQLQELKE